MLKIDKYDFKLGFCPNTYQRLSHLVDYKCINTIGFLVKQDPGF